MQLNNGTPLVICSSDGRYGNCKFVFVYIDSNVFLADRKRVSLQFACRVCVCIYTFLVRFFLGVEV